MVHVANKWLLFRHEFPANLCARMTENIELYSAI